MVNSPETINKDMENILKMNILVDNENKVQLITDKEKNEFDYKPSFEKSEYENDDYNLSKEEDDDVTEIKVKCIPIIKVEEDEPEILVVFSETDETDEECGSDEEDDTYEEDDTDEEDDKMKKRK